MTYKHNNINSFWGYLVVEECIRNGIDYFCISPGSRSTPLTVAVAANPSAKSVVCFDERGAAFHGLGYAKATGKPAVMVCTSGTALANYFPAIVEAKQTCTPLIVISADRPPELKETSANQTIDQVKIFGDYVKWFFELPAPDMNINPAFVLTTIDQIISETMTDKKGPVHLNCMFRKPLEPTEEKIPQAYAEQIKVWESGNNPQTKMSQGIPFLQENEISQLSDFINKSQNGLLVIGNLIPGVDKQLVQNLIRKIGWPVMADIASGLRNQSGMPNLIGRFDQILLHNKSGSIIKPDVILHIGERLVSKRFLKFAADIKPGKYVHLSGTTNRNDPEHVVDYRFTGNLNAICQEIIPHLAIKSHPRLEYLISVNRKIERIITDIIEEHEQISEVSTAKTISKCLPYDHALFLGNSMPVRDFDMYADFNYAPVNVGSNRGASGIDGTLASAIGFAAGQKSAITVVLGDLALIHDLNSLSQIAASDYQVIIIVINNHGGGIFSFLPVSEIEDIFEPYFATAHPLNFKHAAQMFELNYANPETDKELNETYASVIKNKKSALIEITSDRKANSAMHRRIQKLIISNL
jgi:2-succinyl-5-enolpyruvyl-6-hydroxy-3-cyclohexene-1-carboxylate synthase